MNNNPKRILLFFVLLAGILIGYNIKTTQLAKILPAKNEDIIFFDGQAFNDTVRFFEYFDKNGYKATGQQFVYEDFLTEIPAVLLNYKDQLNRLEIFNGNVTKIPVWINQFYLLKRLKIVDQNIEEVPKEIGDLARLEVLIIGNSGLTLLPPEVGNLKKLKILHLYYNRLREIPTKIGNLENLEVLDLSSNEISTLPGEISRLKKLKFLFLGGNRLPENEKEKIRQLLPNTAVFF